MEKPLWDLRRPEEDWEKERMQKQRKLVMEKEKSEKDYLNHLISIQSKGAEQDWCKMLTQWCKVRKSVAVHHNVIGFASM